MDKKYLKKIIAQSPLDLKMISAYLQDSIIIVKDIVFLKKNKSGNFRKNREERPRRGARRERDEPLRAYWPREVLATSAGRLFSGKFP